MRNFHIPCFGHFISADSESVAAQVGADPQYSYNYKRVTAAPRTPERSGRDFNSLASSASTAPPTPVVIQRGLPDSERQMIQNQFDIAQKRRLDPDNRKSSLEQSHNDDVVEVSFEGDHQIAKAPRTDDSLEAEDEGEEWRSLPGEVITVTLEQNNYGLGISLAGKKIIFFLLYFSSTLVTQVTRTERR